MRAQSGGELYTTSITVAEMGYGVGRLPDGTRKGLLRATAAHVFSAFADAQIAAICRLHSAALATRHVNDFVQTGVDIIDPWRDGSESMP